MKITPPCGPESFISYRVDGTGLCGIGPRPSARQSAPVKTPKVPDIVLAASALTRTIRACGYGERTMTAYACPSIWKSSLKRPVPVSKRRSSLRSRGCPIAPIWIRLLLVLRRGLLFLTWMLWPCRGRRWTLLAGAGLFGVSFRACEGGGRKGKFLRGAPFSFRLYRCQYELRLQWTSKRDCS